MSVSENIKNLVENKKITPYRLAKDAGVSNAYLSDLINGKCDNPSVEILRRLSNALNVPIEELIK